MSKEPTKIEEEEKGDETVVDTAATAAEEEAAFASGFKGADSPSDEKKDEIKEPPTEESDKKDEEVKEPPPVVEVKKPTYVQITAEELEELRAGAKKVAEIEGKVTEQFRKAFGTMGTLKQAIDKVSNDRGEINKEALAKLEVDFPELGAQIRDVLVRQGKVEEKIEQSRDASVDLEKLLKKSKDEDIEAEIAEEHPDWKQVIGPWGVKTEFRTWLASKGESYENKVNSTRSPRTLIAALDSFKADRAKKPAPPAKDEKGANGTTSAKGSPQVQRPASGGQPRRDLLRASVQPRGTGATPPRPKSELDHFSDGFKSARG